MTDKNPSETRHSIQLSHTSSFTYDFGDSPSWPFQDLVVQDQNSKISFPSPPLHVIKILDYAKLVLSQFYPLSVWCYFNHLDSGCFLKKKKKKTHEFFAN